MKQTNIWLASTFFFLGSLILSGYLLSVGKSFLQPFVIAVVLWYLIVSLCQALEFRWPNGWRLPYNLALTGAILICGVGVTVFSGIVTGNIDQLNDKIPLYQSRIVEITQSTLQTYVPEAELDASTFLRENVFGAIDFSGLASGLAKTLGEMAGKFGLILVYTLFLVLEYKSFPQKLARITAKGEVQAKTVNILQEVSRDLSAYFKIKTVASLTTAGLSYLIMWGFGVDFPAFWALIIFLFNYIPAVGSPIATSFPVVIALIQFGFGYQWVLLSGSLIGTQVLIGNILEPRYQGNTLNISPLVIVLSLAFWVSLWGVLGGVLCVPIMAILNIVLSKFESTQWISVLISADGEGKGKGMVWHKNLQKQVSKRVKKLRKN